MPKSDPPFDKESRTRDAEELFTKSIRYITGDEIVAAARAGLEKIRNLEGAIPPNLQEVWGELRVLVALLRDFVAGSYKKIPTGSIAAIAAAVLYFVSPIDAIPDFIPGLGYLDDAAVLALCLKMVRKDLERYERWRKNGEVEL